MIAARLAFFFAAYFWVAGVGMSYWPVWLQDRGVDTIGTGTIYMARQMVTVLAILFIGVMASRLVSVRPLMIGLALAASVMAASYQLAWGFVANLLVTLVWGMLWHPILSLGEGISVTTTRQRQIDYSRVRVWGSVSFIIGAVAVGASVERWGPPAVLPVMCIGVVLTIAATVLMPKPTVEPARSGSRFGTRDTVRRLMSDPAFLLFLVATGTCQSSHAILGLVGTLTWRDAGISDGTISLLWAGSIIAEIVFFMVGGRLTARLGATGLLACGAAAGIVRWLCMPYTDNVAALALLQALHALTFGATHLGAMAFLQRALGAGQMAIGQSLYYGLANGLLAAAMYQIGGWMFSRVGTQAYLTMALLCVVSLAATWVLSRIWRGGRALDLSPARAA